MKMDLTKLMRFSEPIKPEELLLKGEREFARLFGMDSSFKGKSRFFSQTKIADILLKNGLVKDLEEGIDKTAELEGDIIHLKYGLARIHYLRVHKYLSPNMDPLYRFEYQWCWRE